MIVMLNPYIIVYEAPLEGRGMTNTAKAGSTYGKGPAAVRAIENQILPAIERMNADGRQCTSKTLVVELGISNESGQPALAEHLCKLRNGGALRKEGASTTTNWIVADPDKQPKHRREVDVCEVGAREAGVREVGAREVEIVFCGKKRAMRGRLSVE